MRCVVVDSIALRDRNKASLPDTRRRNENDINEEDTYDDTGGKDDRE